MKKKLFFFASLLTAAAATLGLTSCSNEMTPDQPIREGMVDVVMTTSLPQALQSYAASSEESGLANLEGQDLQVRYIMEVYNKTTSTEPVVRKICYKPLVSGGDYKTASFLTRLVAAQYNFVFWADIVKKVETKDLDYGSISYEGLSTPFYANRYFISNIDESSDILVHATSSDTYAAGNLQEISAANLGDNGLAHLTGEMYDGYTANEVIDLRSEPTGKSITLKRPFAKLRVITTDADVLKEQGIDPSTINMSLLYGTTIPSTYNALTKASSGIANLNALYKNNAIYDDETDPKVKTVGVMYCLIPASVDNMELSLGVKGSSIYDAISINVENVPLVANKLTTIKGNLFARNPKITINIDDEFEDDETIIDLTEHEVSSVDDLKNALTGKDQRVTFTSKVTKADGFELDFTNVARTTPLYAEGNSATLILNFNSIEEGAVITVKGGANSPKVLQLNTKSKCSVRMDFPATTTVALNGESFKYLVYNCPTKRIVKPSVDALFYVNNDIAAIFFPANVETYHEIALTSAFTLDTEECANAFSHTNGTCNFINTIQSWLNTNSSKTVWDFVGDANN